MTGLLNQSSAITEKKESQLGKINHLGCFPWVTISKKFLYLGDVLTKKNSKDVCQHLRIGIYASIQR